MREQGPELSSLLARIAPSFIRIGHFEALHPSESARNMRQLFLGRGWLTEEDGDTEGPVGGQGNLEGLRDLTAWCRDEVMGLRGMSTKEWFQEVARRNADMVAQWQVRLNIRRCMSSEPNPGVRVLSWSTQYRQYQRPGAHHRLRTVRLHGYMGRGPYLQ